MKIDSTDFNLWDILSNFVEITEEERQIGENLFKEYKKNGYIKKTCKEMLLYSNGVIINFYQRLGKIRGTESPVKDRKDSKWMVESDFCFVNVRATGLNEEFGSLIHSTKILPLIRANAIHLAPFTEYTFNCIYAIRSTKSISINIIDKDLLKKGFGGEKQLKCFTEAVHLLGKTVGFDIEPHLSQFSAECVENPQLFRWIKLYKHDKQYLDYYLSYKDMLKKENQERFTNDIKNIVHKEMKFFDIKTFEFEEDDIEERMLYKKECLRKTIKLLISDGYWTIPSQIWNGAGVPEFSGYNFHHNYAKFHYANRNKEDNSHYAYNILSPFNFYNNLGVNSIPDDNNLPIENKEVVDYFCSIFDKWRDEFNFDFIRYDSADHIFDSTHKGNYDVPDSDRPTPKILEKCIKSSKNELKPYIGNIAERMGNEIDQYHSIGFDLMLGDDMCWKIDENLIKKSFWINEKLASINKDELKFSVIFAIDTHDTGNPFLSGEPLLKKVGEKITFLRLFISRYISCGLSRRPKYEVMGLSDMSYGLFESNIHDKNLTWVSNKKFNQMYNYIEDIYLSHKNILANGQIIENHINNRYCFWVIKNGKNILIPLISLEHENTTDIKNIQIDISKYINKNCSITSYDLYNQKCFKIERTNTILIEDLKYTEAKLFMICEK